MVFSVGPPYRKPVWSNGKLKLLQLEKLTLISYFYSGRLVITLAILTLLTTTTVLFPPGFLESMLELEALPFSFRCTLLALALANFILCFGCEKYLFPWVLTITSAKHMFTFTRGGYSRLADEQKKPPSKKLYKRIIVDMDEERKRI